MNIFAAIGSWDFSKFYSRGHLDGKTNGVFDQIQIVAEPRLYDFHFCFLYYKSLKWSCYNNTSMFVFFLKNSPDILLSGMKLFKSASFVV
jgi:hypothetical protein